MPGDAELLGILGMVLRELKRYEEAVQYLSASIALKPRSLGALNDLGIALVSLDRYEEAEKSFRRALEIDPNFYNALNNLANVLTHTGRYEEALQSQQRAMSAGPATPQAHSSLGGTLTALGRYREAIGQFEAALALDPRYVEAHSHLIFTRDFMPETGFKEHADECKAWYERHAHSLAKRIAPHRNARDPEKKLRVGYVSADFKHHSAATVFAPVIRNHDPSGFEVFLYSGVTGEDATTEAFRRGAQWRRIVELSDQEVSDLVRSDGIDILVDLSAFSAGNRLLVFARKPAPIQVSAWGYAVSTGLPTIDYHFSDPVAVPLEARQYYTETIVDLPCCVSFDPPPHAPEVAPAPSPVAGHVTFGCLNRLSKMSARSVELWSRVLLQVPGSRLLLKDVRLGDETERKRVCDTYAATGVDPQRLVLMPRTFHAEHLAAYGQVDVVLDPTPHTGGVSSFESLWMGVPIVTLLGDSFPARISGAILSVLGLPEWIARTDEEYVDIAVHLARDVDARAALRPALRQRLRDSGLCDERYCRAVERAYREMWVKYCAGA
jgi:predicted O-linked N-acetylglucosamine transferase (SPINDLY family)